MFGNTAVTQAGGGVSNSFGYDTFGRRINQTSPFLIGEGGYNRADFVQYLQNKYPDMDLQSLMQIADSREQTMSGGQPQNQQRMVVGGAPKPFEFKKTPVHTGLKTNQYGTNTIFS